MPHFSQRSLDRLATCDGRLQEILRAAIAHYDFTVLEGHRSEARQNQLYAEGKSKLRYPRSKHNSTPSRAVDVAPYPIDWNDRERFYYLAGLIMGIAKIKGIPLRWGGDWDRDTDFADNTFDDLPHFEIDERGVHP